MNRMLMNATHKDQELRIALANGQFLYDLILESTKREQKSNIYKGRVTRIEPSLEAAFIDYGEERHGFLPLKEVSPLCFKSSGHEHGRRPSINEVLEEGQEIIVQVEKEQRGHKGAALTTFISLPGCYLVLMPNNPQAGGVSRRIDDNERNDLQQVLSDLSLPEEMGLIIRTAGGGRSKEELQWDLDILLRLWQSIQQAAGERSSPFLIYQESNAVIRALRDYLRQDIDEILIDREDVYTDVVNHLKIVRPDFVHRVKLYSDSTPLFNRFQIESQIESAFRREIRLPSGGSIIIDYSEALISIDVNSAKSTKGGDIEETALDTNLEASDEIARQLRIRNSGGLIVIDFIDMLQPRHQREVEERLKKALSVDRARVQVGYISRFGLLEMSRQRLGSSVGDSSRMPCPRCSGQGTIRGIESLSLSIMRLIEEEALKDNTKQVRAIVPVDIASYLLNEKRQAIIDIESRQQVAIIIAPNAHLLTPQYEVERIRASDFNEKEEKFSSYTLTTKQQDSANLALPQGTTQKQHQEPVVKNMTTEATSTSTPTAPIPLTHTPTESRTSPKPTSLLKKILGFLFRKKPQASLSTQDQRKPFKRNANAARNNFKSNRNRPHNRSGGRHDRGSHRNSNSNNRYRNQDQQESRQATHAAPAPAAATPTVVPIHTHQTAPLVPREIESSIHHHTTTVAPVVTTTTTQIQPVARDPHHPRRSRSRGHRRSNRGPKPPAAATPLAGEDIYSNNKGNSEE